MKVGNPKGFTALSNHEVTIDQNIHFRLRKIITFQCLVHVYKMIAPNMGVPSKGRTESPITPCIQIVQIDHCGTVCLFLKNKIILRTHLPPTYLQPSVRPRVPQKFIQLFTLYASARKVASWPWLGNHYCSPLEEQWSQTKLPQLQQSVIKKMKNVYAWLN